jgi:thiamine biosynthesis protein ThiI
MMYDVILIRFGEIGLKGQNRPFFESALARNARRAVGRPVRRVWGRLLVEAGDDPEGVLSQVTRVFGVVSASPAAKAPLDLEAIKATSLEVFRDGDKGRTFKVETRRANKGFPHQSRQVSAEVGAHILRNTPGVSVDVHCPEVTVRVEIRDEEAYVFSRVVPGPGGLPVGTGGRAILLLSGGIDSPVAGWMTMKRGVVLEACHFFSFPFTGPKARQKVEDLCRVLSAYSGGMTLHVVPFTETQTAIREHCPEDLRVTVMRRMMVRMAQEIAVRKRALALVTGESIGQVASQTLESMASINAVVTMPVLRPLSGLDKTEITERAKAIGTYDISIRPYEDCCSLFLPRHPKTKPTPEEAANAERQLDIATLVERAVRDTERVRFGGMNKPGFEGP